MSESELHRFLVKALVKEISSFQIWKRAPLIYCDIDELGICKSSPSIIGKSKPDVLAHDIEKQTNVVGEAKSPYDIDNQHTIEQLVDYFRYLSFRLNPELWIAVPWMSAGTALRIGRLSREKAETPNIPIKVTEYMIGDSSIKRFWNE